MKMSVVIPVFNEEENVSKLHSEIVSICAKNNYEFEIIFVDDGSTDQTLKRLKELTPVKIIEFRRNFGQTAAIDSGIREASGDIIITLDGDGQNDPEDIPKLLQKLDEGFDVVSGWRQKRFDSLSKKIISRGANFLRRIILEDSIHDSGCTLKVYRKKCFERLELFGEMHRFIPELLISDGFRVAEIPVNHRNRWSGETKYTLARTLKGLVDMISVWFWRKYSSRPLHLFGGAGILSIMIGSFGILLLFILRILGYITLSSSIWPLVFFVFVLIGIQLFVTGLIADVGIKSYYAGSRFKPYVVKDIYEQS